MIGESFSLQNLPHIFETFGRLLPLFGTVTHVSLACAHADFASNHYDERTRQQRAAALIDSNVMLLQPKVETPSPKCLFNRLFQT